MKMLLVLVLVIGVAALTPRPKHIPRYIFGRPYGGFINQIDFSSRENMVDLFDCNNVSFSESFILQPVDHFANFKYYWPQFYQYNSKFYNNSSNLVFLILGGEAPIRSKFVCKDNIPYLSWAKKYGAAVFQVEHRYFGYSRPAPTMTVSNLKWLTPEQTLADYNNFIKEMNKRYFGEKRMRWVLFGGSYAGTLVAWMRVAYPNSTIGGIASSADVNFVVDNYKNAVNMQKNYKRTTPHCAANIYAAFKEIQSMSYSIFGRAHLKSIFNLCADFPLPQKIRSKHLQFFWANIFNTFLSLNQYSSYNRNNDTINDFGMPKACEIMNNASEPNLIMRVRNVLQWVSSLNGEENACTPNSYDEYVSYMSSVTYDQKGDVAAGRAWIYQCCSYIASFSTTDGGYDSAIWGSLLPVDFYVDLCIDIFSPKINLDFTSAQVEKYREMFGGAKHYKGSKIVFTNGNMDPWFSLGLRPDDQNRVNQVFATTIDGGTHCSDMYPARPQDSGSLKAARAIIASKLDYFIQSC